MRTFIFNFIKMKKLKLVSLAIAMACATPSFAGGLLTNTNQHVAFNRMMSREASIGIDGVYYNPAGVVFMGEGHHLAINWQLAYQTRSIENDYALFTNNVNNPITPRTFKGEAFAPVIPSFQYAYNKGRWSLQASFALTGGGGKCTFDNGLGSFEKIVAETAMAACGLAKLLTTYWAIHLDSQECKCLQPIKLSVRKANIVTIAICMDVSTITVSL